MNSNHIKDLLTSRVERLDHLITDIENKIPKFPPGRIMIKKRGNKEYYYLTVDSSTRLMKDDDMELVTSVVYKTYLEKVLKAAKQEYAALKTVTDDLPSLTAEQIYDSLTDERKTLIRPIDQSDDQFVKEWLTRPYRHKGFKQDAPVYTTMKGERVRSKSEIIIADRLASKGIPYKYECPVKLKDGIVLHPDFSILRMSDRKEIYLEHLGKLGDQGYADDNVKRLNNYAASGLILGANLFITYETDDVPLDTRMFDILIETMFR